MRKAKKPKNDTPSPPPDDSNDIVLYRDPNAAGAPSLRSRLGQSVTGAGRAVGGAIVGGAQAVAGGAQTIAGVAQGGAHIVAGGAQSVAGGAIAVAGGAMAVAGGAQQVAQNLGSKAKAAGAVAGRGALRAGQTTLNATVAAPTQVLSLLKQHPALGHPTIQKLLASLQVQQWVDLTSKVDIETAENNVRLLEKQFPHETPRQIAHRLMMQKALYAGGSGLASSIVPGAALPLLAVDWAATALLQAELVLQIAIAYGLDPHDPQRRAETLAIIGLTVGGNRALKAGLAAFRGAPVAGAVIGAATNSLMIYALGYGACRYYEAKLYENCDDTSIALTQQANDDFLEDAAEQQVIIDHILSHIVLAGSRHRFWQDIRPELQLLNLSEDSLNAIAEHMSRPQPLNSLLDRLQPDFALTVLSYCYRIAYYDGILSPEESAILEAIATRFELDLAELEKTYRQGANINTGRFVGTRAAG